MENCQKSNRHNLINSALIRNTNQSKPSVQSELRLTLIEAERIKLSRIDFRPIFIKQDPNNFSDWFGMITNDSEIDSEITPIRLN